jgi:hypothetical protein
VERRKPLLAFGSKKPKKLPAFQVYSKLYYDEKIKDILMERWRNERHLEDEYDTENPAARPTIKFQNKVTRELYDAESQEVKENVEKHRSRERESSSDEEEGEGEREDVALAVRRKQATKRNQ